MAKRKAKPPLRWYARVGRWRRGSHWVAKPRAGQLRKDSKGRYIDGTGKRVPASAIAPEKKSQKRKAKAKAPVKKKEPKPKYRPITDYLEPPKYTWDGASGRWRRDGRYSAPPKAKDLKRDEQGRYLDSAGRRVPPRAIPDLPVRLVKPRREVIEKIGRGETIVQKEFLSSTFRNNKPPSNAGDIFENMLERHAAKGPFSPEDVVIYQHGLKYVGSEKLTPEVLSELKQTLGPGLQIKYADTKAGTEVYVYLGKTPKIGEQTTNSFEKHKESLDAIYRQLLDYWGELDWYVWGEADEALYG